MINTDKIISKFINRELTSKSELEFRDDLKQDKDEQSNFLTELIIRELLIAKSMEEDWNTIQNVRSAMVAEGQQKLVKRFIFFVLAVILIGMGFVYLLG